MRAREVQLQTICNGRQFAGYCNKLLHGTAKNRDQQKSICWHVEASQAFKGFVYSRVGQSDSVNETAGGILAIDRFSITGTGLKTDAFGRDDTDLGNSVHHPLNDGRCRCHNTRRNREGA
jgi:hypothetical protein